MQRRVQAVSIAIGILVVAMLCWELVTGGLMAGGLMAGGLATNGSAADAPGSSTTGDGATTDARSLPKAQAATRKPPAPTHGQRRAAAPLTTDDVAPSDQDAELARSDLGPETQPSSRVSEVRATVALRNTCSVAVELYWVDYEGRERSYGTIAPAQTLDLATYAGHSWHLRTANGALLRGGVAGDGERWVTCDDHHRPAASAITTPSYDPDWPADASPRSMQPAEIAVANNCGRDVELRWVDYHGRERVYAALGAGDRWTQASYHGHLWRVRDAHGAAIHDFRAFPGASITACRDARRDG